MRNLGPDSGLDGEPGTFLLKLDGLAGLKTELIGQPLGQAHGEAIAPLAKFNDRDASR